MTNESTRKGPDKEEERIAYVAAAFKSYREANAK